VIIIVWQPWWTVALLIVALLLNQRAFFLVRKYKRMLRAQGNAVYRLPVIPPGHPKTTVIIGGSPPQEMHWERDVGT
jgi:hypothetical protein